MANTARDVLGRIAASVEAMHALDSIPETAGEPMALNPDGTLHLSPDGVPSNPGTMHKTLGDYVRAALG